MNSEPPKPRSGNEDDSWESLAENLFGIEFNRHDDADELISPEELFSDETAPADEPEGVALEDFTRDDSTGEGRAGEFAEEIDSPAESPAPARGEDEEQYWDVLREWAADVSDAGEQSHWSPAKGKRKKKERRAAPERAAASEEESPAAQRYEDEESEEFLADSDFAAGLLEGEPSPKRSRPPRRGDRDLETEAEELESQRRRETGERSESEPRRPRRRRGRRGRPEEDEPRRPVSAEDEIEEPFGFEGEEEEESPRAEQEREQPRERRPRRRRRRESAGREERPVRRSPADDSDEEEVLVDWNAEPIVDATPDDGADEDEDREAVAAYRGIPTWEEAIACLLNPSAPEPRSGEREPGGRPSGREGGRRRRRRR